MDKESKLILINREFLTITGIKKVLAVSESSISLTLESSTLNILGSNMEVKKLDVDSGILEVGGRIDNIKYLGLKEKLGFIRRIFK